VSVTHRKPNVGDEYKDSRTGQTSRWNGKTWVTTDHDRTLPAMMEDVRPGIVGAFEVKDIQINEWHPTPDGTGPATQVHLVIRFYGIGCPFVWRFKGPESLGQIIAAFTRHRASVWPDAPDLM
jgi:hypothetical protein